MKVWLAFLFLIPAAVRAETLDVDFSDFCQFHLKPRFDQIDCRSIPPFVLDQKDEGGNPWKIRFHFGFSRTRYAPTDLHIQSGDMNVVVRDVEMVERTSAGHYDPRTWDSIQSAFQWIDEPTNTFAVSFEKGDHVIYITVFHPKYLKSVLYKKSEIEGQPVYSFRDIGESDDFSQTIPEGYSMLYLGNTHLNMNWQIGYGHKFTLFNSRAHGRLVYIPKADIGIGTGKARSVNIVPGSRWDDHQDAWKVQSYNASIGHRLEYERGRLSVFVDHKVIFSNVEHGFFEGTIDYTLRATPLTFGVGIDLFKGRRRD